MKLSIGEVLRLAHVQRSKVAKIKILQQNQSPAFASYLRHVFDPNLKFLLPKGDIEYNPLSHSADAVNRGAFNQYLRKLYMFIEGGNPNLTDDQRLKLFVSMLENIDPLDAEAAIAMKDKQLPYKSLTRKLIEEAFPGFLPPEPIVEKAKKKLAEVIKPANTEANAD